jgi:NAD(P)-dependent dehydrogenase (short-subunit alcohol dehydrogenase family)
MNIAEQTVLVTGSNRGLGKAMTKELLSRGAKVYASARDIQSIDIPGAIPLQLDITDEESIQRAAKDAKDVTILINNAGVSTDTSLLSGDLTKIHLEYNTHVFGTLSMIRSFSPIIEKNGGGTILNILSALSWLADGSNGAYSSAKSAEWGLTNALRLELAPKRVKMIGLHVAYMDTDMFMNKDVPKTAPEKIAKTAIDGIQSGTTEILADEISRSLQQGLSGGVQALYPDLK